MSGESRDKSGSKAEEMNWEARSGHSGWKRFVVVWGNLPALTCEKFQAHCCFREELLFGTFSLNLYRKSIYGGFQRGRISRPSTNENKIYFLFLALTYRGNGESIIP
ncbi:hypothetical protein ZIOFF_011785 [Zingiber officinale]|uniref:Uncharacterized protein n=1 Tax=Zingiber officinale TaxID=94328 RepID=A0A8J5LL14_ZINOF|nr:hypothetical protein ZIOFF_011785 [Zingiber officinale]